MKKKLFIILAIIGICILGIYIWVSNIQQKLDELKKLDIVNVAISNINDGTYHGSYSVFPVSVELEVVVANHKITAINIIKHQNGQGTAAETIVDDVIDHQTLEIDTVTGATYSSKVILKAIEKALVEANN